MVAGCSLHVAGHAVDKTGMAMGSNNAVRWEAALVQQDDPTKAPRRREGSDAQIVLPGRGLQYQGQIVELSPEGCLIETKCRIEAGTAVEVWLRTEGMPLRLAATLVDRHERGVAFKFQPMPERKAEQVRTLCAELGLKQGGAQG